MMQQIVISSLSPKKHEQYSISGRETGQSEDSLSTICTNLMYTKFKLCIHNRE